MTDYIEFPRLFGGISFKINRMAFEVFGLKIYWYGIIIAAGFLTAVILAMKQCRKHNIDQERLIDAILIAMPAAIIFARLFYVVFSWENYKDNLLEVFNIRNGGLAIYGGVIGGLLAGWIYFRFRKLKPLKYFDYIAPYIAIAQAIGRWGNFVNQEAFGTNTNLPWGMKGDGITRYLVNSQEELQAQGITIDPDAAVHPTFLYESLWNILVFIVLIIMRKKKKVNGEVILLYLVLYGLGRVWIEGLRTDSLMVGSLRISQLIAGICVLIFGGLFAYIRIKKHNKEIEEIKQNEPGVFEEENKEEEPERSIYSDLIDEMKKEKEEKADDNANDDIKKEEVDSENEKGENSTEKE